jgi:hypothetical protein
MIQEQNGLSRLPEAGRMSGPTRNVSILSRRPRAASWPQGKYHWFKGKRRHAAARCHSL